MINTITLNPALDYVVKMDNLRTGDINRADSEEVFIGGKGINVSFVLKELGISSVALGFVSGFTGSAIEQGLADAGIQTDFVRLNSGFSRINVKLRYSEETDINGCGPDISESEFEEFMKKLSALSDGDTVVIAGSVPKSVPCDIYEKILERLSDRKIRIVVDAAKSLLLNTLKFKPFLIKPNIAELGDLFGVSISTADEAAEYAEKLQKMGACNVLVSMGGSGALLLDENHHKHLCGVCKGVVKNTVGAGDSMVAGFLAGIEKGDFKYALKLGTAAGGASAFSDGLPTKDKIMCLLEQL